MNFSFKNFYNELWNYRQFIFSCVKREYISLYHNSFLTLFWTFLTPVATLIVYITVFSNLMSTKLSVISIDTSHHSSYAIFLCSGIIFWELFSNITTKLNYVFIENSAIVKKIKFPKICLPLYKTIISVINFLIFISFFLIYVVFTDSFPIILFLYLFLIFILIIIFSFSIGLILSVANVYSRDFGHFFVFFINIWFWITPIVYPIGVLPQNILNVFKFNPMFQIIDSVRQIIIQKQFPNINSILYIIFINLIISLLAYYVYNKYSNEMVDKL